MLIGPRSLHFLAEERQIKYRQPKCVKPATILRKADFFLKREEFKEVKIMCWKDETT